MGDEDRRVAVIGAGISGLVCARGLARAGAAVTVFEKSRGVGGRMATRRATEGLRFDHGAQYFTARDERFAAEVGRWVDAGVAAPWEGRLCTLTSGRVEPKERDKTRYVGVPGMNALCKDLAAGLETRFSTRVGAIKADGSEKRLTSDEGADLGAYDLVVVSTPAPQAADLLGAAPALQEKVRGVPMQGCLAAMLAFDRPLGLEYDGAFVHESGLSWIARNSSKPGRDGDAEAWVVHAGPEWSDKHMELSPEELLPRLTELFWEATGLAPVEPTYATSHRWRYAIPPAPLEDRCLFDAERGIGVCGDWCAGPRVEGAYLSGLALRERVAD